MVSREYDSSYPFIIINNYQLRIRITHTLKYNDFISDNVHFQHSAQLMKALIESNVDYRSQIYADKNHFISGADHHLYRTITKFLKHDCWDGGDPREIKPGDDDWVDPPIG